MKMLKWTIEIEVSENWVEDGFDLNSNRCRELADSLLSWSYPEEVKVRVVSAPDPKEIRKIQGYDG